MVFNYSQNECSYIFVCETGYLSTFNGLKKDEIQLEACNLIQFPEKICHACVVFIEEGHSISPT